MDMFQNFRSTRRKFIKKSATATLGVAFLPLSLCSQKSVSVNEALQIEPLPGILKRKFANLDFEVTTMGLGGQAALQLTPSNVDPAAIIVKAIKLGINYFDTSNTYGNSQLHYNKAFKALNLIPGQANFDQNLRKSIWLTSKTKMKWGSPGWPERPNVSNTSHGATVKTAVDDLKRSLIQMFGDNKSFYPEGSYLDLILIHSLGNFETVDVLYEGLETDLDPNGNFGALVALRDYRDGTNLTGTNPKKEKLVKHIGFSGHLNPPAMVDMIQRDEYGIFDAILVAINSNDKTKYNMQYNVIPVAEKKGMGIIGMKVFADAALYHKPPRWSNSTDDLFLKIGTTELPSRPLIEYSLTTPGVHTLIIGIGHIDEDPQSCQLVRNLNDAQILPDGLSESERKKIEELTTSLKPNSNFFQMSKVGLTKPRNLRNIGNVVMWDNAFSGDYQLKHYEIHVNGSKVGEVLHQAQILKSLPFNFEVPLKDSDKVEITAVDLKGARATETLIISGTTSAQLTKHDKVKIYPNPVLTELTISGISSASSMIAIYNSSGAKLFEKPTQGSETVFNVSTLRKGLYFVRFDDGFSAKFLKQ